MDEKFWVLEWLEENNITSLEKADRFLRRAKTFDTLAQRAEAASSDGIKHARPGQSILAGTGIDFVGGHSVCPSPSCMRLQVDELFRRVWHYFDRIVVTDIFSPALLEEPHLSREDIIDAFLTHLPPLLYLREIGAEHLIEYAPKIHCQDHWPEHAKEEGLGEVFERQQSIKDQLREGATFSFENNDAGERGYWMSSPDMTISTGIPLREFPESTEEQLQRALVDIVFNEQFGELTSDVTSAHQLNLPLGAISPIHARMLRASCPPTVADVAFRLNLPILDGVPIKELVHLRESEQESFLRFRDSLRAAVRERVALPNSGTAQSIADQIQQDLIEPSLNRIRQQLAASERTLAKKAAVGIFLGTLATTCSILCGLSPELAVPAGIAIIAPATNSAAQKHIDEKEGITISDMYFLWKATEHAHH